MSAPHPTIDSSDATAVVTETRAEVAHLSEARAALLVAVSAAGRHVVLVSDERTRLTYPLREALRDAGGFWVVREESGAMRDGLDGRRLDSIADAVTRGPLASADDVAVRYLRPARPDAVQLVISQSVRHKAIRTTLLGGPMELLAEQLTGAVPAGWGAHEPAVVTWDRGRLSEFVRGRMPDETTVMVAGSVAQPLIGTIRAARTSGGLEETTQVVLGVGAPGSAAAAAAIERLPEIFAGLAHQMPLFGLVVARTGRADLTFPSILEVPPSPLGMLIGPPGVRELHLDVPDLTARLGARVVGRPRIPGLYFPLGAFDRPGWQALDAVVETIGLERVRAVLGSAGGQLEGALRASRP